MNRFAPGLFDPQSSNPLERALARLLGFLSWAVLALLGLVFMFSLLVWVLIMALFSLVSGWITGRPSTVSQLWAGYRQMAGQRWPQSGRQGRTTPADDSHPAGAARPSAADVQDVKWRDLPGGGDQTPDR